MNGRRRTLDTGAVVASACRRDRSSPINVGRSTLYSLSSLPFIWRMRLLMLRSLVFGLTANVVFAATPAALTVDELVAKNIQARGGLEKIKSVKSSKASGRITIGPGTEAPIVV